MNSLVLMYQKAWRLVLLFAVILYGEKVCKLSYHDFPSNLDGITIEAPRDAVSLSEAITVKQPDDSSITLMNTPAIMFVIDNSGSMFRPHQYSANKKDSTYELARDPEGNRFSVTLALIDSLYQKDPASEVGLTVFGSDLHYDNTGEVTKYIDPDAISNYYNNTFVAFVQLNKEYENNGKKEIGYNILKYFLETQEVNETVDFEDSKGKDLGDTTVTYTMLKNLSPRLTVYDYGTDITLAFDAVKAGLDYTEVVEKNQYVIFFSDGVPSGSSNNDFVKGKGVPTTYTVFFNPDMMAPQVLKDMNKNIQDNGYSSSNPKSELWPFDNSSHEELLEFMVENILNKISEEVTTEPIEITINGKSNGEWIDGKFKFTEQFELMGELSPFKFDISYSILTKSSDGKEELDTINEIVDFSVERKENPTLLDSVMVEYWDREILFYNSGSKISAINEKSDELELRFKESRVDCNYRYSDVEIILTSTKMGDELIVTLDEEDEHNFSKTIPVDFKTTAPDKGDYVLQIAPDDEIVAFFANPKLKLDTLTAAIGTDISNSLTINSATYWDKNADGFIDEISMEYNSLLPISETVVDELQKVMQLPSFRAFEVTNVAVTKSELRLSVFEDRDVFQTYCSAKDVIKISEKDLDSLIIESQELVVRDSVAPIIEDSVVSVVRAVDKTTLSVTFSEEVNDFDSQNPLFFYDGSTKYNCTLKESDMDNKSFRFIVTKGSETLESGDSVHVNFSTKIIGDVQGNWQQNRKNIKRVLSVVDEVKVTEATYYDGNCDGHPDTIEVSLESQVSLDGVEVSELISLFSLPSFREFDIKKDEISLENSTLVIPVKEKRQEINTATTDDDIIEIQEKLFDSYFVSSGRLAIIDSMAPVIKSNPVLYINTLDDKKMDTLHVIFSEEVEEPNEEYLLRFYRDKISFKAELELLNFNEENATFGIRDFTKEKRELLEGDSVNINLGLFDLNGTEQHHSFNIKRPIDIELLLPEIKVRLVAVNPYVLKETTVPDEIIELIKDVDRYELEENDSGYAGCLIMTQFEPPSLLSQVDMDIEGSLSIFDKVGNTLVEDMSMEFVKELGQLVYLWNGKNNLNRIVGGDSFVATANIKLQINRAFSLQYKDEIIISTQKE